MNTNPHVSPKDFFLHLGAAIALYASAIALINLEFEIVNRALPDALTSYYSASSVVWPISMLIVLTPLLYILEKFILRDISKMLEKREIWIRKWRIYLTLFLTGVTIAVDIIVLINTYLNGEISSRFIWKVVIVLIVSAVIFAYYILSKSVAVGPKKTWLNILAVIGIVIVLGTIVAGFIIVGSPGTQRALRFDTQRTNDLSNIQSQVTYYWQRTGALPKSLSDLNDPLSNYIVPADPETGVPYNYSIDMSSSVSPWTFKICATFDIELYTRAQGGNSNGSSYPIQAPPAAYPLKMAVVDNWSHSAGESCFTRSIDPKLYPRVGKQ